MKQFSQACQRNQEPILEVLQEVLADAERVLEVGSGTGQHAVFFARHLPHLVWQPSDRPGSLDSVQAWRDDAALDNVCEPVALDLFEESWPVGEFDAFFSANVIHIAPLEATERLFSHAKEHLRSGGLVLFYGPFRYAERPLEPSNERFDHWLRERDPDSGVRLFEDIEAFAHRHGFTLVDDRAMPANNRMLVWQKR
jgi:SAM-dependent methyltransferase